MTAAASTAPRRSQRLLNHDSRLVLTMAFALGLMTYEQTTIGYLLPFIKADFALTNSQIGMLASAYWVTFAASSYLTGAFVGTRGSIKKSLVGILIIFGLASLLCGAVIQATMLLWARALMGALAGALLTLIQTTLGLSSSPKRVGMNMGLVNGLGGNLFCLIIAPLALVYIASHFGWRAGFLTIVGPAFLCTALVALLLQEPERALSATPATGRTHLHAALQGLAEALRHRNIILCALLCSLFVAYVSIAFTFLPLFFVETRGFPAMEMSLLMVVLGVSAIMFSIGLPALSNRLGRKPVLVVAALTSMILPLAACYFSGPVAILAVLMFIGWGLSGSGPFFMGIIPAETVDPEVMSTALGIIISLGVLIGGLAGPSFAGWVADIWGPRAPLLVQAGCAALAAIASGALHETVRNP